MHESLATTFLRSLVEQIRWGEVVTYVSGPDHRKNGAGWRIRTADLLITKRQPKHSLIN